MQEGVRAANGSIVTQAETCYEASLNGTQVRFTTDRDKAKEEEALSLLGIEHPLVRRLIHDHRATPPLQRGLVGRVRGDAPIHGALSIWHIQIHGGKGQYHQKVVTIGLNENGDRSRPIERAAASLRDLAAAQECLLPEERRADWIRSLVPEMIRRELTHSGLLGNGASLSVRLLAWVELV